MKFAKDLDEDLIPEWKSKYFDYRQGKKRIKAIASGSVKNAPRSLQISGTARSTLTSSKKKSPELPEPSVTRDKARASETVAEWTTSTPARPIPSSSHHASQPTKDDLEQHVGSDGRIYTQYGSMLGTPPPVPPKPPALLLPEPALESPQQTERGSAQPRQSNNPSGIYGTPESDAPRSSGSAYEVGLTKHASASSRHLVKRHTNAMKAQNANALRRERDKPLLKRMFSRGSTTLQGSPIADIPLEVVEAIDSREKELWRFCERELDKIEKFYKIKEDEAGEMLSAIQKQLHQLRDQHMQEKNAEAEAKLKQKKEEKARREERERKRSHAEQADHPDAQGEQRSHSLSQGVDLIYHPIRTAKQVSFHRPSGAGPLATPPRRDATRSADYERTLSRPEVSYRYAKRKLKGALFVFNRSLDLLKSYCMLNEKAFRKLNKKYDKAVHARLPMWFMSKHVNGAYFVRSTILDAHFNSVEDLYARYFEKGNRKTAIGKLRARPLIGNHGWTILVNGICFAAGLVLGVQGLVSASKLLFSGDPQLGVVTSYLLQLYAGYLLMLLLVLYFCVDCWIFTRAKVNYVFIFEFDTRHNLDWREQFELPCLFFLFLGLVMFLNFTFVQYRSMYIYWPCILIGSTACILFFPYPMLYHNSRAWFLESNARLFAAGLLKVVFRDFFLGDMFCSLAYSLGNIELFFCLYAHDWDDPEQCNSTHSRLLGFFTALPGIIRFLQCVRRYADTRHAFPHLANCAKYGCTILYYASLSCYRIDDTAGWRAFFITSALVNSLYCTFWDVAYDWSIGQLSSANVGLRDNIAYKWRWSYYVAAIFDAIVRFNWVFYARYAHDVQHSSLVSFFVGLSEVTRRGVWTLFRVENEHCTNVGRFRATPDIKLPYSTSAERLDLTTAHAEDYEVGADGTTDQDERTSARLTPRQAAASGADLEHAMSRDSGGQGMRRRPGHGSARIRSDTGTSTRARVGTILQSAHAQDFERQKKTEDHTEEDDDDDEDEYDQQDDEEEYRKALEEEELEEAVEDEQPDEPRSPLITPKGRLYTP